MFDGAPSFDYQPQTWAALGYLALLSSAFAYILFYRVLHTAGAGNLSLVTLLMAPVAVILGALVYGEALQPTAYLGLAAARRWHGGHRRPHLCDFPRENRLDVPVSPT